MRGALKALLKNPLRNCEGYCVAEIGVWTGVNALQMITKLGDKLEMIHLVDHYRREYPYNDGSPPELNHLKAQTLLKPYQDICHWHICSSVEAASRIADSSLHFVYIDADHSYKSVRQDIEAWLPKIVKYGILAGHDWILPEVRKAVEDFTQEYNVRPLLTGGADWWFYK